MSRIDHCRYREKNVGRLSLQISLLSAHKNLCNCPGKSRHASIPMGGNNVSDGDEISGGGIAEQQLKLSKYVKQ